MNGELGLGPSHRLRKRPEFLKVYENGAKVHGKYLVLFCLHRNDPAPWRLGVTVTKKVGGAVVRNRLKRCFREAVRQMGASILPGLDIVVTAKRNAPTADFEQLRRDIQLSLNKTGGFGNPASQGKKPANGDSL